MSRNLAPRPARGYYVETDECDDDGDPFVGRIVYAEDAWDAAHLALVFHLMSDHERELLHFHVYPMRRNAAETGVQPWGGLFHVDTTPEGDKLVAEGRWIHGGETDG